MTIHPSLLVTFAAAILAPEPALESGGRVWGLINTGMAQGCLNSGGFQAIGNQPSLLKLDLACRAGGGLAVAGADDTYANGPLEVVLPAFQSYGLEATTTFIPSFYRQGPLYRWTSLSA